jgi:hypothetical protein
MHCLNQKICKEYVTIKDSVNSFLKYKRYWFDFLELFFIVPGRNR